jgi:hypothetical protein
MLRRLRGSTVSDDPPISEADRRKDEHNRWIEQHMIKRVQLPERPRMSK